MFPLAWYTFRESLRDRIYLGFLVAMSLLTAIFVVAGSTPWGLENYVVERLGWMSVDILLCVQTAIYAVNNVYRERERRILYNHLTLPIGRVGYLSGKALGLLATIVVLAGIGAFIILLGDRLLTHLYAWRWQVLWLVPTVLLKNLILLGFAFLFAQLASNALTTSLFTLGLYLVGNGAEEILLLADSAGGSLGSVVQFVYYLIPNLKLVDFQHALYADTLGIAEFGTALVYAASYAALSFALACVLFRRKDL